jgi:hypothetical protein
LNIGGPDEAGMLPRRGQAACPREGAAQFVESILRSAIRAPR